MFGEGKKIQVTWKEGELGCVGLIQIALFQTQVTSHHLKPCFLFQGEVVCLPTLLQVPSSSGSSGKGSEGCGRGPEVDWEGEIIQSAGIYPCSLFAIPETRAGTLG